MSDFPAKRPPLTPPVVTGRELLALVLYTGQAMLASETREQYLVRKDKFIYLLTIAEHDAYCAPILIAHVQTILDEESRIFHSARFDNER